MTTNEIVVLFEGYSFKSEENNKIVYKANCSCTLIKTRNGINILVDTLTPWDSKKLLTALSQQGLSEDDINVVICTHGHSDHTGNNNLFPNLKTLIVGQTVSLQDEYDLEADFVKGFKISEDIQVIATPGHTLECSTVIVRNSNLGSCVCITGDLFEKEEDIKDPSLWIEAGSANEGDQRKNRLSIAELADYIIPGHGGGFKVNDEIVKMLKEQMNLNG
ncbi:hypothetical protein ACFFRR_003660 [Megaselia abdita]